jgi:hypothetical protein
LLQRRLDALHILLRHRLFLKPHGFEGFGVVAELATEDDLVLSDREEKAICLKLSRPW